MRSRHRHVGSDILRHVQSIARMFAEVFRKCRPLVRFIIDRKLEAVFMHRPVGRVLPSAGEFGPT